jgi:hypothetical protein
VRTWAIQIAKELLPGSRVEDRGADVHLTTSGGLAISKKNGAWFRHASGTGGYSTIKLIALLRQCSDTEAVDWARAWLASHAGTGDCGNDDEDDGASEAAAAASKARAEQILRQAGPADGTVVATYLNTRGINIPLPGSIKHSPDARIGESAMVAMLHARCVDVGNHVVYIDALGRKSLHKPEKQTFLTDRTRGKGAVCVLQENKDTAFPILLAEGVEDGLSLIAAGRTETIWAIPGVRVLQHVEVPRKRKVIVVRDGDAAKSDADKALIAGLDHLLLELGDDAVRVTETPLDADANSILTSGNDGAAQLNALIDAAVPAVLSFSGEVKKLARLHASSAPDDAVEFARLRIEISEKFKVPLRQLNRLIKAAASFEDADDQEPKQTDRLLEIAEQAELFHAPDGTGFSTMPVDGHSETWALKSRGFKRWLVGQFLDQTASAPNSEALKTALNAMEARAARGPEMEVYEPPPSAIASTSTSLTQTGVPSRSHRRAGKSSTTRPSASAAPRACARCPIPHAVAPSTNCARS